MRATWVSIGVYDECGRTPLSTPLLSRWNDGGGVLKGSLKLPGKPPSDWGEAFDTGRQLCGRPIESKERTEGD